MYPQSGFRETNTKTLGKNRSFEENKGYLPIKLPMHLPGLKCIFCSNFKQIGQVVLVLALDPHNANNIGITYKRTLFEIRVHLNGYFR